MSTASVYDVPPAWLEQLADGGVLVAPIWMASGFMPIARLVRHGDKLQGQLWTCAGFMALQGPWGYDEMRSTADSRRNPELQSLLGRPVSVSQPDFLSGRGFRWSDYGALAIYLSLSDARATGVLHEDRSGTKVARVALWDPGVSSLACVWQPDFSIAAYGTHEMHQRLLEAADHWRQLGAPDVNCYDVTVGHGSEALSERGDSFCVAQSRSWHTWSFSLRR